MNLRASAVHVAACLVVGGLVAAFTPAKWLAAAFWVSAALFFNGSMAAVEDAVPGGFDNPDGSATPSLAKGFGAIRFTLVSLAITAVLACLGFYVQFGLTL